MKQTRQYEIHRWRSGMVLAAMTGGALFASACSDSPTATEPLAAARPGLVANVSTRSVGANIAGAVYVATNNASANTVVAFGRDNKGTLTEIGTFNTEGQGVGGGVDPLTSQFSILLSPAGAAQRSLYVVNAGSNDITVFRVHADANLEWMQKISSDGVEPISLAIHHNRLYVLNAGDSSVSSYRIANDGTLASLASGHQWLPHGVGGPSTIRVSGNGVELLVSERTANRIDYFPLDATGAPGTGMWVASDGAVPFGFDVGHDQLVLVSEAGPNAVSSYKVPATGGLNSVEASVPTKGAATCWLRITNNVRYAYTANAGSSTITTFGIGGSGKIYPHATITSLPSGATPLDLDVTQDDQYLYTLETGAGAIGAFKIGATGALTALAGASGVVAPASGAQGIAAW